MNFPDSKFEIRSVEDLFLAIHQETEHLQTSEGDEIECISIENLNSILENFFNNKPE